MFSRSILMFLSFLYLFIVMSILTVENLEEILEEKLRKVIEPLSKQIEDACYAISERLQLVNMTKLLKH